MDTITAVTVMLIIWVVTFSATVGIIMWITHNMTIQVTHEAKVTEPQMYSSVIPIDPFFDKDGEDKNDYEAINDLVKSIQNTMLEKENEV